MAAKRGGKGGSASEFGAAASGTGPKADGILPSFAEVFPKGAAPAAPAAPEEAPKSALQKHYASNPGQRGMRPFKVHSEIDTEGNANQLTPEQVRANKTADDAAVEFDKIQADKKAGRQAEAAAQLAAGGKPRTIFRSTKPVAKPTNRTTGVHVPQEMGIKEFAQKIAGMHSILDTHAKSVQSLTLRPQAADDVNEATGHLKDAKFHIGQAETARRGVVVGNKRYSGDAEAGRHYISALGSLRKAHDLLGGEHVSHAAYLNNLSVELPSQHLGDLEGAANTIPVLKKAAPFKSMEFGGTQIDPKTVDLKAAEKLAGKDTEAVRKLRAGQRGVAKRQDKFKVVTGQEEKVEGGLTGRGTTTRGRKGIVGSIPNPKRRASGQRSIEGRLRNSDMTRGQTPTWEGKPVEKGEENPGGKK